MKIAVMRNRPLAISLVAFIFILAGGVGILYHATDYWKPNSNPYELVGVLFIRILAIVCGVLLLRRVPAARWLAILWLAYHCVLSFYHSTAEMMTHFVFLAIVSLLLFIPKSSAYFKDAY
ncbi:hypothetical protein [Adhaeribacter pallidiroseus]|uniref:DoxX family protein n=1 Tax=Adhaeribacter pallidiroseus TaxID=2072847 RepID=A0A369Q6N9_9BACT|nr:hypothetical protein [Adhaeribacter pallidiroseus]RDC58786.1 hypothetical protein AHMF7616_05220 [Adhaeribacter pallidiroseus]